MSTLAGRDLYITALSAASEARGWFTALLTLRPNNRATIAFFRSFATLAAAGVPLRRALATGIAQSTCPALREALRSVAHDVENGLPLSTAIERRRHDFGDTAALLVRAGESGGTLEETLLRLAALLERREAVARRIATALAYPAFVSIAACGLVIFLLTSVLPMFDTLYTQMRVPLPAGTAFLLRASAVLRSPFSVLAIGCVCATLAAGVSLLVRRAGSVRALYGVPVAGEIARKAALARISHTVGILLRSGVPIGTALDAASEGAARTPFRGAIDRIKRAIAAGATLTEPMQRERLFDPVLVQLVRAGEEAGSLDAMFLKAAEYYHADVEAGLDAAAALVEPAMILILGLIVVVLVASIMLPLYSMIGNIR